MKKLLVSALTVFLLLGACGVTKDENVDAKAPNGFVMVSKDEFDDGNIEIYVFQHIKTGCYYTYVDEYSSGDLEQMYKMNGGNYPYCD